jgi:hypothetical protein
MMIWLVLVHTLLSFLGAKPHYLTVRPTCKHDINHALFVWPACLQAAAAAAGAAGLPGGVGGGSIDTRKRLVDFPEGAAIADLER